MRAPIRAAALAVAVVVALLAVLAAPSVASADDEESGSFGLGDHLTLGFQGATLSAETVGTDPMTSAVAPVELSGGLGIFRISAGGYMRRTRFGSFAGVELSMGLGWLSKSAIVQNDAELEEMTWGRLYLDMETGLTLLLLERFDVLGSFRVRASVQGGVGWSNDFDYVYTGARLATSLIGRTEGEASYSFRWGTSYAGGDAAEHRLTGTLIFGHRGWGLGAELWSGDQTHMADPMLTGTPTEQPTPGRAFKGRYSVLLLSITRRWR